MTPTLKSRAQLYALGTLVVGAALISTIPSVNDNKVTRFVMDLFRCRSSVETSSEASPSFQAKPQCISNLEFLMKQRMSSTGNTVTIDSLIENALLAAYNTASASGDGVIEEHLAEILKVSVEEVRVLMNQALENNLPMAVLVTPLDNYDTELPD
jgi:hypothetical protein